MAYTGASQPASSTIKRCLFDSETDGLLVTVSKHHIIGGVDLDTKEKFWYLEGDLRWMEVFDQLVLLVGHNILGYDLPALFKLYRWKPKKHTKIHDTMIMSQSMNYRRFGMDGHSLARWGEFFGYPKLDHNDWSKYTPEMHVYWERDIDLNVKVYEYLLVELRRMIDRKPVFAESLRNEHAVAEFCARAELEGWGFNREKGIALLDRFAQRMKEIEDKINPLIGMKTVAKDRVKGVDKVIKPKWIKNGDYDHHLANWFGIDKATGQNFDRLVEGEYCRVEFVQQTIRNDDGVKEMLYRHGWQPLLWNRKKVPDPNKPGRDMWINTSPKLCEDSLFAIGEVGELIDEYNTLESRNGILKGWIKQSEKDGRVYGSIFTIGTPTGRATHSGIVNVPSADAKWGPEIRELFMAAPGNKIVGVDSAGNQLRAFCHYLGNAEYTHEVIHGDAHQRHANILTDVLHDLKVFKEEEKVSRKGAKPFLYAYLFGGGGPKLALIVIGRADQKIGNKLKTEFQKRIPGLKDLNDKLMGIYYSTEKEGKPYIPCIDGRRIYCDSPHKALNYLLQSFEAISMKAAIRMTLEHFDQKYPDGFGMSKVRPRIWMHDETQVECPEEIAEEVKEFTLNAYVEAAKAFGIMILGSAGAVGNNWKETH